MSRSILLLLATLGLAACARPNQPPNPPPGPRADAYRNDYAACDTSVPNAVDKRNAKTGLAWIASPIRRWGQIADGIDACMAAKGWGNPPA